MTTKAANTGNGYPSGMKNRIINGGMDISQRGTSFAAASGYTLDRWVASASGTDGAITVTQSSDVPSTNEFQYSLRATVTTADTSLAAGQASDLGQNIEGYNVRDLIGRTFTISFYVRSSKTGIHCISLRNSGLDRTYISEYTVNAANAWEYKTITIAGGLTVAGTWNYTNGMGLYLRWMLANGSTYQTTAGSWVTGHFYSTANQVNCLDTIGNIFAITGVQLELGSVATPFEHRLYGTELALCQRYYEQLTGINGVTVAGGGYCSSTTVANSVISIVPKRAAPSGSYTGPLAVLSIAGVVPVTVGNTITYAGASTVMFQVSVASGLTTGAACMLYANGSTATINLSAEL